MLTDKGEKIIDDKPKSLTKDQLIELRNLIQAEIDRGRSDTTYADGKRDWEEDPIEIPELGLKITSKDYYEILPDGTKKEFFTWDEAMEIEKKTDGEWRLPTCVEMMKIVCALGEKDGDIDRDTLVAALKLEQKGWVGSDGDIQDAGLEDNLWTSRAYNASYSRYLLTNTTSVYPRNYNLKGYGFSVRLVRRME